MESSNSCEQEKIQYLTEMQLQPAYHELISPTSPAWQKRDSYATRSGDFFAYQYPFKMGQGFLQDSDFFEMQEEANDLVDECFTPLPKCLMVSKQSSEKNDIPSATIHNIVSTSIINGSEMPINLNLLSLLLPCSSYDRRRFAAITVRINKPKCTALLFTSGKLVVTGVRSWYESLLASLIIARLINTVMIGQTYMVVNCEIQNIVAHSEITSKSKSSLNIQSMYEDFSMECTYQKNMFPGLIYRAKDSPIVLLCFYSGRIVLTGGKSDSDIKTGWEKLYPILKRYLK